MLKCLSKPRAANWARVMAFLGHLGLRHVLLSLDERANESSAARSQCREPACMIGTVILWEDNPNQTDLVREGTSARDRKGTGCYRKFSLSQC